jgi:hypothetical protein
MVRLRKAEPVRSFTSSISSHMVSRDFRLLPLTGLLILSSWIALEGVKPLKANAQTPEIPAELPADQDLDAVDDELDLTDPAVSDDLRPLSQNGSILSVQGGQRLMDDASAAVSAQNYDLAIQRLQEARQVFNQLSNFYQELAASFSGIDNRIAEEQRNQAVETAQMRDQATYQLALVHRAQNKPELAVPLLVQIIRSQNPTRDLGQRAYQQLFELGFVDSPYPRGSNEPTSTVPNR